MINQIQTIKNLRKQFPRFRIDTILKIVECISEGESNVNGILIEPKHHKGDITSKNQKIISSEYTELVNSKSDSE